MLTLRAGRADDLPAICEIERSPGYELRVGRSSPAEHEAMLASPRYGYFVAEGEGVEAFAILRDRGDVHGGVYLKRIAARPGRGVGAPFFAALLREVFTQSPAHRMFLDCFEDNARAQDLYARFGFTRDGILREAYLAPDGRRNLVLMCLLRSEWLSGAAGR